MWSTHAMAETAAEIGVGVGAFMALVAELFADGRPRRSG